MNESSYNYIHTLKEVFTQRQKANAYYSLRAYARDLNVHPSTLSLILNGKRRLPIKNLKATITALNLSPVKEGLFKESFYRVKAKLDDIQIKEEYQKRYILDEAHHNIIAEWEHYAVLSLVEIKDFKSNPEFVAQKLEITVDRAEIVLENLLKANLLKIEDNRYKLTQNSLRTTEDISSKALRKSHIETL
ncbi:MAG: TIGR02147 family protein, partial [Bacteriovoracaceae bacterium]|nr:TIGR02147 family protein [Bacteriovoracaceae bacterium]